ncbi:response regulator [Glycomyces harbinensis]|uniref:DNA-binding response regulator, NarL/FixJ family, contains REC and HTH domains n=1 Tax=Glycomyces harbinensis TaxID=58114 RepID=A0A1G7BYU6_9ACTN|nr:response regulator transcription factor [Glycomyces harbinensis]SDE31385.1 DNA-binding response regulator, NarL/FixJ family, contains REC and HTH domains [Glycomyces harbinensis]
MSDGAPMLNVLVVDDDPLVRAGLRMILGGAGDLAVVGEAGSGTEVPALVERLRPDVVLMDLHMPGVDGLTATERLRSAPGAPEVLVLTAFEADGHVRRALRAGAGGFLLKDTPPADIVAAVRRVAAGEPVLSPEVTRRLIGLAVGGAEDRRTAARERLALLNERETEIAVEVGRGSANAEIAAAVHLSVPTVKTHVSAALAKLGLNNRVQLALLVNDAGLAE